MVQKKLEEMNVTEKKAMIYDLICSRDRINADIQTLQNSINQDLLKPAPIPVPPIKEKK